MADIPDAVVEKVARAICRRNLLSTRQPDDAATVNSYWMSFVPEAKDAISASKWADIKDALVDLGKATKASLELADTKLVEFVEKFKTNGLDVTKARSPEAQAAYDACKSALDKARAALQVTT